MEEKIDWKKTIQKYKISGQSQLAFCKENKITYAKFRYHYRKTDINNSVFEEVKIKPDIENLLTLKNQISLNLTLSNLQVSLKLEF
jgi:hypothetical protein